jgi:hypothetical protein
MNAWAIVSDVHLDPLFAWALDHAGADRILVVCPRWRRGLLRRLVSPSEPVAREILGQALLAEIPTMVWPVTEMLEGPPDLAFVARFGMSEAQAMLARQPLLFSWLQTHQPPLPEDICLFKDGDSLPVFFSTTHEKRAWAICHSIPPFAPDAAPASLEELRTNIPVGPNFVMNARQQR